LRSINRIGLVGSVVALAAVGVLSACTAKPAAEKPVGGSFSNSSSAAAAPSTSPTHEPAVVTITPAPESTQVNPIEGVKIAVANGTLKDVVMTSPEGVTVKGSLSQDRTSWATTEDLGYDKTYAVKATALNPQGEEKVASTTLSTVKPANLTMPYIQTAAGGAVDGMTFGVGQVIRVHFDEKITDRATAQKAISVKITPAQVGGFNWLGDQDVYWRTKDYMKAGSKVSISVKAYGVDFGGGLYGQADPTPVSFKVGHKQISIVSDKDLQMRVYRDDKLVRTVPVSMGRHVSIKGDNGQDIDLRTNSGPHVVVGGEKQIKMSSGTFGVDPKTNPNGYSVTIPVGVRISYDGEYVHWASWSVWAQGNTDTSHGCLNVSPDNAYWFYDFSQPGDIVDVRDTGRKLQLWNSGYWTVSWADWLKGNPAQ
jgi:lipoprotein-anchoring transpeptidase ErfK/SrfK